MAEFLELEVTIPLDTVGLPGELSIPAGARGIVIFAHGSGSSRLSPRNTLVAGQLRQAGIATLLFDLLSTAEDLDYSRRFDIALLTRRLELATHWVQRYPRTAALSIGYFGASTGSAAAIFAAASSAEIRAVVSRGGRPDLAMEALPRIHCPTLLIVGGADTEVLALNRQAYDRIPAVKSLEVVLGATHLFEETGALEAVARLATAWFAQYLQ